MTERVTTKEKGELMCNPLNEVRSVPSPLSEHLWASYFWANKDNTVLAGYATTFSLN